MDIKLTHGFIQKILDGEEVSNGVVQILGYKKVPGSNVPDRYRLQISDGVDVSTMVMLGTQLNPLILNNELEKFTVVRINKWVCNKLADKKLIMLLDVSVIVPGNSVGVKIGSPTIMSQSSSVAGSSAVHNQPPNGNVVTNIGSRKRSYDEISSSNQNIHPNIHPISSLTPYQNKWTIKARVTSKAPVHHWSNSRGEGKVFSVNLLDESGEIRATGFNDTVDKFSDLLEVNKVYFISKGTIKPAKKSFSSVKNDYEITFNNDTTISLCDDDSVSIPMLKFNFVPIRQIEGIDPDSVIDVIAICKTAFDVTTITSRNTSKEFIKRDIILVDDSNIEIRFTLWGVDAEKFDAVDNPVVAVKGAKVSEFNGKYISLLSSSVLQVNPDITEAHYLKGWYSTEGRHLNSMSLSASVSRSSESELKTFAQVEMENLGMGDKPDYYNTKATITLVRKENCMYKSCPVDECKKKVRDLNNGNYQCDKCCKEYSQFKWRFLLSLSVADHTGSQWVTCFQEIAEQILDITADELGSIRETNEDKFNDIMSDANFKSFNFSFRTKMETFNEETRLKTQVMSVSPIDCVSYGKKLLNRIKDI